VISPLKIVVGDERLFWLSEARFKSEAFIDCKNKVLPKIAIKNKVRQS
jgi:hypothetical protein